MKKIKRYLTSPYLILSAFNLVIVSIWYRNRLLFAGGEGGLPFYNLEKSYELFSHLWYPANGGFSVLGFIPKIPYFWIAKELSLMGLTGMTIQFFTFLILVMVGTFSVYFLVKHTLAEHLAKNLSERVSSLSGIFYLLNPLSMTQVWGRGSLSLIFGFALIPLFFLLFLLAIKKKKPIYLNLGVIFSFVFSVSFTSPTQAIVLWFLPIVYFLYHVWISKKNKKDVFRAFFYLFYYLFLWLVTHWWWIQPNLKLGAEVYSGYLSAAENNLGTLRGISKQNSLTYVLRLIHKGSFFEASYYGDIYSNPIFILISWMFPFLLIFSFKLRHKSKHFKYFLLVLGISLFVVLGSNPPLGWLFEFFFKRIPPLQSFRNPYEKFGLIYTIAYVPLMVLGLLEFLKWFGRRFGNKLLRVIIYVTFLILPLLYVWPMWTGEFAGGKKINPWVEVPSYYKEADSWLEKQKGDSRILHLPLNPGDGLRYEWRNYYQGTDPSEFLFNRRSIAKNVGVNKLFYNVLLDRFGVLQKNVFGPDPDISSSSFKSETFVEELSKLNVGYIILHKDIDESISNMREWKQDVEFLDREAGIERIKNFDQLIIYGVEKPKEVSLIYSSSANSSYSRISPTEYEVLVDNEELPFDLYFLDLFDRGWVAEIDGEVLDTHNRVFSYANAWKITKKGDLKIKIKYQPQTYLDTGLTVTKYSVYFIVLFSVYLVLRDREDKGKVV